MNVEQRQAAADPQTKPPDLGCESACRLLSSMITYAIYCQCQSTTTHACCHHCTADLHTNTDTLSFCQYQIILLAETKTSMRLKWQTADRCQTCQWLTADRCQTCQWLTVTSPATFAVEHKATRITVRSALTTAEQRQRGNSTGHQYVAHGSRLTENFPLHDGLCCWICHQTGHGILNSVTLDEVSWLYTGFLKA